MLSRVGVGRVGVGRVGFRRSDMMLKHGISFLGYLDNGLGYYRFSYNGSNKSYVGVMARKGRRGSEWPHSRYETALSPDVSTRLSVTSEARDVTAADQSATSRPR
jgi:hypothetical protein